MVYFVHKVTLECLEVILAVTQIGWGVSVINKSVIQLVYL